MRQREYQVEIRNGQERFSLFVQPVKTIGPLAGGTVAIAAGVRDKMFLAAMAALIEMSAQGGRAAGHDGAQDLPMLEGQTVCLRVWRHPGPQHLRQRQASRSRLNARRLHIPGSG
jgi:hypothetical protein